MVKVSVSVHPRGLNPFQSAKAWFLRKKLKQPWAKVRFQTRTVGGKRPGQSAAEGAAWRVEARKDEADGIAKLNYANCGRLPLLSEPDKERTVEFVKRWRAKRFCTSPYIRDPAHERRPLADPFVLCFKAVPRTTPLFSPARRQL